MLYTEDNGDYLIGNNGDYIMVGHNGIPESGIVRKGLWSGDRRYERHIGAC